MRHISLILFNLLMPLIRNRVQKHFTKPSLTKDSEREASDMNVIYKRYAAADVDLLSRSVVRDFVRSNKLNDVAIAPDFDFREAQNRLVQLDQVFSSLNAQQRAFFNNDPIAFAQAASSRDSIQKLIDLKIVDAPNAADTTAANPSPTGGEVKTSKSAAKAAPASEA